MDSIILCYSGVHQIIQLALAAQEMGELDSLHCSILDRPGKLGSLISRFMHSPSARPLDGEKIQPARVHEFPLPFLAGKLVARILPQRFSEQWHTNTWFDAHAAKMVRRSKARVFIGGEACAQFSMEAARQRGMTCILDCPGVPSGFLDEQAQRAAHEFGISIPPSSNSPRMKERKARELELADVVLCCSDFQKSLLVSQGVPAGHIHVNPLWVDAGFWRSAQPSRSQNDHRGPLRVLYAGGISLRKGLPYLLKAMKTLGARATLTLVGSIAADMTGLLGKYSIDRHLPYLPKEKLRGLFEEHDLLIMPTLGDSFGFIVLEAMAAGLPVIVSEHCGAPLPDETWRVPAADAAALALRIQYYLDQPGKLLEHGSLGAAFAAQFTPERFRGNARAIFTSLLAA